MRLKVTIVLVLAFWMTGTFASDNIEVFFKDAVSKPVYIYKSPRSKKVIAKVREWEDTISTCFHSVYIEKKSRKRYYVSVCDIWNSENEEIRGWVNKEECVVNLREVLVGDFDSLHYYVVRLFNKPTDREPAIVLRSDDYWSLDIKSYTVVVTDAMAVDYYEYPYNVWLRVLVELQTGEKLDLWTVDYSSGIYDPVGFPPAGRLQEYDKRK